MHGELRLARPLRLRKTSFGRNHRGTRKQDSFFQGVRGMDCPATHGRNRLYSAALNGSLLIASPLLYLIFVAIIAFRDRVRMNALMHQRVVALNLAPLSCGKFRFAKSKQYLAPSHPSSSIQSSSADVSRNPNKRWQYRVSGLSVALSSQCAAFISMSARISSSV